MLILTLCALLVAAPARPATDGRGVRAAFRVAEKTIDERITQMTSRTPFVLLGSTRGAYLNGYGAVFTLEVNLVPVANISPFRPAYSRQEIQDLNRRKREKLAELKAGLRELLKAQAAALDIVPGGEKIALVVTLFNYNWEDTTGLPSQVVLQGQRQMLLIPTANDTQAIEVREF